MNIFGFGATSAEFRIRFSGEDSRANLPPPSQLRFSNKLISESSSSGPASSSRKTSARTSQKFQVFKGDEHVTGAVVVSMAEGKKIEHLGVKVELVGLIELMFERGSNYEFTVSVRELEPAGYLEDKKEYNFDFSNVDKPHDSYYGTCVRLRYFLRVTASRSYASNIVQEQDFFVQTLGVAPEINNTIKMEVGIEDCLHIEFEYNKSKYHLRDVIVGKIYFLLVRIKIKHMEIAIVRRESAGSGSDKFNESETVTKYEIMDGAPVKGESIPVRLFLSSLNLTPTFRNINNKFSVKYFINLVLVDEEDRRYFKQQEITIWRKVIG